jgi:predicted dithiol-disulfide oxidoreductase (DUF899 family)
MFNILCKGANPMTTSVVQQAKVVRAQDWIKARRELLAEERELPWTRVEKDYVFDGPGGQETLGDLFAGRTQLIVSHFMFGPGWKEGCVGCSFRSDHVDGAMVHLEHHDVSLVTISRAPLAEIEAFRKRMGWKFKWVSSLGSDFNYDFRVSFTREEIETGRVYYNYEVRDFLSEEMSGISVFSR